ncbi:MAG: flagellar hook-basal body complex protein FliE [Oscillospiraceae bacterium]|nr:flagellar hook-basal body complex protein FliE [Oscillospiraceae bacterium]
MVNIIPVSSSINSLGAVGGGPSIAAPGQKSPSAFTDFLKDAVKNIEELDAIKAQDAYNLSVGDVDNLAELATNAEKYDISVQMLVQIRNKLLDSYSEIMRMNV